MFREKLKYAPSGIRLTVSMKSGTGDRAAFPWRFCLSFSLGCVFPQTDSMQDL